MEPIKIQDVKEEDFGKFRDELLDVVDKYRDKINPKLAFCTLMDNAVYIALHCAPSKKIGENAVREFIEFTLAQYKK